MEQVVQYKSNQSIELRHFAIASLFRKIKVKLTRDQFTALQRLVQFWLSTVDVPTALPEKAFYLAVYKVYDKHLQRAVLNLKDNVKLSFDLVHADLLYNLLTEDFNLAADSYELAVINSIIAQIDQQL